MKPLSLLPLVILAVAACNETATAPRSLRTPLVPSRVINEANGPNGAHLVTGTPNPSCTVNSDLSVTCNSYEIAGVGNTDATANLSATYTATIDCFNPGVNPNNPIESHTTTFTASATSGEISPKNGRLTIPSLTANPFSAPQVCPNPNWTPKIRSGTLTLVSYTYTVTFDGFSGAFITLTGP